MGALTRLLSSLGRPLSAISALVLTHAHFDHVGFAARLRTRGTPVLVHRDDAQLLRIRSSTTTSDPASGTYPPGSPAC
ncbi:MAG: MBL fold metallo-hydrolase [Gaiellales bacterium]